MSTTAKVIAAAVAVAVIVACALTVTVNRFNAAEIESLREGADARGQSYELEIHEPVFNTYSFRVLES
ncbi:MULTISPECIES: hypothetical protein [Corynebacterium]|uniref:hypothetical protein n=1 Tax=Corynebacterium TaxID=1716 RepID=UPI00254B3330|nr:MULTISPECIES: hypothetical protein [Corynebacterium]MDK6260580.1 hypothetical protein [Corynebacterium frankenforstense]MDK8896032.1 hypothetical protein [Corynebacterium sp. MSK006]